MATVEQWVVMTNDKVWTEEEKAEWLAEHGETPTHVVTFEPMYQIEVCVPPWEQADRQIARSAVAWGKSMRGLFDQEQAGGAVVVAAHHEGNALEIYMTARRLPRLHRVV
ncbi:MAG TPA: hypothetical protein VMF35_13155 [Acidimicrobiales bacterium]|nr:hypothetical protein [Acidimicrobiales bacterium]